MPKWHAIVLAASRGTSDSMAQSYGVLHKCTIEIGGQAMISHVVAALQDSSRVSSIAISTETESVYARALDVQRRSVVHVPSQSSAPSSALYAAITHGTFPILVTTGDHALLTAEMVQHVCDTSVELAADFTVGLASDHVIQDAYPETKRTFFRFGHDRVSGCNLFTIHNAAGLKVLERWQSLERNRKQPTHQDEWRGDQEHSAGCRGDGLHHHVTNRKWEGLDLLRRAKE